MGDDGTRCGWRCSGRCAWSSTARRSRCRAPSAGRCWRCWRSPKAAPSPSTTSWTRCGPPSRRTPPDRPCTPTSPGCAPPRSGGDRLQTRQDGYRLDLGARLDVAGARRCCSRTAAQPERDGGAGPPAAGACPVARAGARRPRRHHADRDRRRGMRSAAPRGDRRPDRRGRRRGPGRRRRRARRRGARRRSVARAGRAAADAGAGGHRAGRRSAARRRDTGAGWPTRPAWTRRPRWMRWNATSQAAPRGRPPAGSPPRPRPTTRLFGAKRRSPRCTGCSRASGWSRSSGPGGVGKTRVALEVAGQSARRPCCCSRPSPTRPRSARAGVGAAPGRHAGRRAGGLRRGAGRPTRPAGRRQLRAPARRGPRHGRGDLTACPRLSVLATSREPVGAAVEYAYRLPPLALPAARTRQDRRRSRPRSRCSSTGPPACARPRADARRPPHGRRHRPPPRRAAAGDRARRRAAVDVLPRRPAPPARPRARPARRPDRRRGPAPDAARHRRMVLRAARGPRSSGCSGTWRSSSTVWTDTAERLAADLGLAGDPGSVLSRLVDASMVDADFARRHPLPDVETLRTFGLDRLEAAGEDRGRRTAVDRLGGPAAPRRSTRRIVTDARPRRTRCCAVSWRTCGRRGGSPATAEPLTTPPRCSSRCTTPSPPRAAGDPRLGRRLVAEVPRRSGGPARHRGAGLAARGRVPPR